MAGKIVSHKDLVVFQKAFTAAMELFNLSKGFPKEERYALTDQGRRSARSVCGNIAEAWRKRRYEAAFIAKLSGAEGEAAETQVWIEFAYQCGYLETDITNQLFATYEQILKSLVQMINHPEKWTIG